MVSGEHMPAKRFSAAEIRARTDAFHEVYYYTRLWERAHWLGVPAWKCPLDMWVVQELITETRPDVIVECGTALGGSAMYFASICRLLGNGRVISIDVKDPTGLPSDPLVRFVRGSSVDAATVERVRGMIRVDERVMLVLDSLHSREHVIRELRAWSGLVSPGCYCVVEDTNINGHPVYTDYAPDSGPGAYEAVDEFLATSAADGGGDGSFVRDPSREKLLLTFNPGGYLRCVAERATLLGTVPADAIDGAGAEPGTPMNDGDADPARALAAVRFEMDAAKRLAIARYEAIEALSATLAMERERSASNARWLERRLASSEARRDAEVVRAREAEAALGAALTRARADAGALAAKLDERVGLLRRAYEALDEACRARDAARSTVVEREAEARMATGRAERAEAMLMERDRTIADLRAQIEGLSVDVDALRLRVEHLEGIEATRREQPGAEARAARGWWRGQRGDAPGTKEPSFGMMPGPARPPGSR